MKELIFRIKNTGFELPHSMLMINKYITPSKVSVIVVVVFIDVVMTD